MKNKLALLSLGFAAAISFGCGDNTEKETAALAASGHTTIIASNKISISVDPQNNGNANIVKASQAVSQPVEIETNVPEFMTFTAASNISFNVSALTSITANGEITLDLIYNDLASPDLQSCSIRAYMLDQDGLAGKTMPGSIIPLELKVVGVKQYKKLTTTPEEIQQWDVPFDRVIKGKFVIQLKGDFSNAFKQVYHGTLVLDFVRNDAIDTTGLIYVLQADGLYSINTDGSNKKLIRNDVNNHDCAGMMLDPLSSTIYFTHWDQPNQITKAPLDASRPVTTIASGPSYGGQGIALDVSEGKLFTGIYYGGSFQ